MTVTRSTQGVVRINQTQLASLVALAQAGSVTGAAAMLSYSTSAVSAHIKPLERQLGAPLVRRTRDGCALTQVGRRAAEVASSILDDYATLRSIAAAGAPGSGACAGGGSSSEYLVARMNR